MKRFLVSSSLLLLCGLALAAQTAGDRLIDAVQHEDVGLAKELIAQGADVNAKSRYGATPLFFACDKGNVELVELLLAAGADVNVVDSFYGATPLTWVSFSVQESEPHRQILGLLLARKPEDAASVLPLAAEMGDRELLELVVASGKVDVSQLVGALEVAKGEGHDEAASYLANQLPAGALESRLVIPPDVLQTYTGSYVNPESGNVFKVFFDEGILRAQGPGQQPFTLDAESEARFVLRQAPEIALEFRRNSSQAVNQLVVLQAEGEIVLERQATVADTEEETKSAADAPSETASLPVAERTAPRPWPAFRGANAAGIGDGQGVVADWDGPSGKNVLWKTAIPGLANSSPIIWGDKVFVTTASTEEGDQSLRIGLYGDVDSIEDTAEHTWAIYALDKKTGEIAWHRVAAIGVPKVKRHLKSTHANPTPVTDGEHVIASFGSEGIYCYDFAGKLKWKKDLGVLESGWFYDPTYQWGFASSPIIHGDRVILQIDIYQGSHIMALDVATGQEIWRTDRDEIPTWGTPVILPAGAGGKAEIVTNGTTVRGYDADSGELVWWLAPNSEITVASPIVGSGLAYVTGGYPPARPVYAVRSGGRGDLSLGAGETATATIAWSHDKGGVYMPTPLLYRGILYLFHGNGRLAAHDPKTGESIYKGRVGSGNSFSGSPVAADGRLYFTSEQGDTFVVRAGEDFELLGKNTLDEEVMSTPAISDGLVAIRAKSHVYGIGAKAPSP